MRLKGQIIILFFVAFALTGCGSKNSPDPVQFAHLAPRSGADKAIGEHAEHGILLAVEEANQAEGQVAGRSVAVLHGDTRNDPKVIQSEAVRFITINRVAGLLGGPSTEEAEPLARVARQTVPLVTPAGLSKRQINPYVFSLGLSPAAEGQALARFASGEPVNAARTAVLINARNDFSTAVAAAFVETLRKEKGSIVKEWPYDKESELRDVARSIAADKPGAVVLAAAARDISKLVQELRQAGLDAKTPLFFGGEEATGRGGATVPLPLDPGFVGDIYLATVYFDGVKNARLDEFANKYRERFASAPDIHAVQAYDAARMLFDACRRAKAFQGPKIRDELAQLGTFESLTGTLSFDKEQAVRRPVYIVRMTKGRLELIRSFEPDPK